MLPRTQMVEESYSTEGARDECRYCDVISKQLSDHDTDIINKVFKNFAKPDFSHLSEVENKAAAARWIDEIGKRSEFLNYIVEKFFHDSMIDWSIMYHREKCGLIS